MGQNVFPAPQPTDLTKMNYNNYAYQTTTLNPPAMSGSTPGTADAFTISGAGIVNELKLAVAPPYAGMYAVTLVVDGVEKNMAVINTAAGTQYGVWEGGLNENFNSTTAYSQVFSINTPIRFTTSFTLRIKNTSTSAGAMSMVARMSYYT